MSSRHDIGLMGAALGGATLGFLAGVLAAPRSGRDSRRRLARRIEDEREELARRGRKAVRDAADSLDEQFDRGKQVIARAIGR